MKILFVCKWNRFRSKIAESYFNKVNKNKKIKAKSVGVIAGFLPLDDYQVKLAKSLGIELKGKTNGLSSKVLDDSNKIVLLSKDIPVKLFSPKYKKKLIVWNIPDVKFGDVEGSKKIIMNIIKNVDRLLLTINNTS